MKQRRVRFSAIAQQHVAREQAWWLEHRDHAEVFAEELKQAINVVATLQGPAHRTHVHRCPGVRRIYLRRVALHLYYAFDDEEVIVYALSGARRRRGP